MSEVEQAFRDALARIDRAAPPLRPVRPTDIPHGRAYHAHGSWLIGAAAVLVVAGVGTFGYQFTLRPAPVAAVPAATTAPSESIEPTPKGLPTPGETVVRPTASPDETYPNPLFAEARALPDAPAAIDDPDASIDCGSVWLGQGEAIPIESLDCLARYAGDENVEFRLSRPTTEGDPIISFFVGEPEAEALDVYTTSHWDKWGEDGWTHTRCPLSAIRDSRSLLTCS
jgi:hypothetical protein